MAGFFLLGVAPLVLAGGWCAWRHRPDRVRAEAESLGRELGLCARAGDVQYVRPGVVVYKRLELLDPETGRPVFRCQRLEVAERPGAGKHRTTIAVRAEEPEAALAARERIWRCLERWIETAPGRFDADCRFTASRLTLVAADRSQTLREVDGTWETLPEGTQAQVHFRVVGADTPEPARIRLVRNRHVSPPANGFELSTGGGELPCGLLALGWDDFGPLGPRCRFRGYIWANETPGGWQGEVTGQLARLDLGGLVSDCLAHHMTGVGDVTIQQARFHGGRLEEGAGVVAAGPGTIDRSLLEAAVGRLGMVASEALARSPLRDGPRTDEQVSYRQLAFSVAFDARGVQIRGRCQDAEPGTVLAGDRGSLMGESATPRPIAALVETLALPGVLQVPASRQTDWLLGHLPLPGPTSPRQSLR